MIVIRDISKSLTLIVLETVIVCVGVGVKWRLNAG